MSLLKWAIFGLLMLPFLEIAVFVAVALKLGVLAALALTILTSLAGMAVIRSAGRGDIERVRTAFGPRTMSRVELDGRGFLTVLGGFLLLLPGFITDDRGAAAASPTRRWIRAALRRAVSARRARERPAEVVDLPPGPVAPRSRGTHRHTSHPTDRLRKWASLWPLGACVSHTAESAGPPAPSRRISMATTNGGAADRGARRHPAAAAQRLAQYIKDLSFENPNAPRSLQQQQRSRRSTSRSTSTPSRWRRTTSRSSSRSRAAPR